MWTMIRCLMSVLVLLLPTAAFGQPLPDWTSRVDIGKPLVVTTTSGERVEGVAGQLAADGLVVATPVGIRTVRYDDMRQVEKRDSVWSGVAIGAALGLGVGVLWRAQIDCGSPCSDEANAVIGGGALYGALIGWGLDAALKGRQTLFQADASPVPIALSVRHRGISARVAITW